jgi:hypothetical protein
VGALDCRADSAGGVSETAPLPHLLASERKVFLVCWLNHYLFCFHDSTLECLATYVAGQQRTASLRDLLHELADRLLD